MGCAHAQITVGRPRWTSPSTRSTACQSSGARTTSAPPDLKRGWGYRVRSSGLCNMLALVAILLCLVPRFDYVRRQRRGSIASGQASRQHGPQLGQRVRDQCAGLDSAALVVSLMRSGNVFAGVLNVCRGQDPGQPFVAR